MKLFLPLAFLAIFVSADAMGSKKREFDWRDPIESSSQGGGTQKTIHPRGHIYQLQFYKDGQQTEEEQFREMGSSPVQSPPLKSIKKRGVWFYSH